VSIIHSTNGHIVPGRLSLPVERIEMEYKPLEMGEQDREWFECIRNFHQNICTSFAIPVQMLYPPSKEEIEQQAQAERIVRRIRYGAIYAASEKRYSCPYKTSAKRRRIVQRKMAEGQYHANWE
jgi:hypothetical protein